MPRGWGPLLLGLFLLVLCISDLDLMWKILKEIGIQDHLTCLLRNLYAGQETLELDMEQQNVSK